MHKELALLFSFAWLAFAIAVSLLSIPNHVQIVGGDFSYYIRFGNWGIGDYIDYCHNLDTGYIPIGFFTFASKIIGIIQAIKIIISLLPAVFFTISYLILKEHGKERAILFSALSAITIFLYVIWCGTIKSEFALCFIIAGIYFLKQKNYKIAGLMAILVFLSNASMALFLTFTIPILALYLSEFAPEWKLIFVLGSIALLTWVLFGPLIEKDIFPAIFSYQENRIKLLGVVLLLTDLLILLLTLGKLSWTSSILLTFSFSGILMSILIMQDGWNLRHFYMAFAFSYLFCVQGCAELEGQGKQKEARTIQNIFLITFLLWLINMGFNIYANWP